MTDRKPLCPGLHGAGGPAAPGVSELHLDPFYKRQACGHPLLILQVLLSKKVNQGDLLLFCPIAEESPHCQGVANTTDGVAQHHLIGTQG